MPASKPTKPNPARKKPSASANANPRRPALPGVPARFDSVDPKWLARALGLSLVAALFCAWLALCLLVYQGEWQLVLHPVPAITRTPADAGLLYLDVPFDSAATGQPRLTGWWIPAEPSARFGSVTVLFLHDGSLSLSANLPTLGLLHQAGVNVFAVDYRGFGRSDTSAHPTQARMTEDTEAALRYLITLRHTSPHDILPYGVGLGASLAAALAQAHPELPGVVLDNPNPDPTATALAAQPSHFVPVRLLFRERFEIAQPLTTLRTPKLLLAGGPNAASAASPAGPAAILALQGLFRTAASPSYAVTLPTGPAGDYTQPYQTALRRFLDEYLPAQAPALRKPDLP